jgi:phenylacetate-CoA ligase
MSRVGGRCDEILIVKGVNVHPKRVGTILKSALGVEPAYQLVVEKRNHQDLLGLRIEVSEDIFFDKMEKQRSMVDELRKKIRDTLGITPQVWLVEAGSIHRLEETAPMVIDKRT